MKVPAYLAFIFGLCFLVTGCEKCAYREEPQFGLVFLRGGQEEFVTYERVYGLGGNGDIGINPEDSRYRLPISFHQDSSTYILQSADGRVDTLTIRYRREMKYQDRLCGFRMYLHDMRRGRRSTFARVEVIDYLVSPTFLFTSREDIYEIRIIL